MLLSVFAGCLAITTATSVWLTPDRLIVLVVPLATVAAVVALDLWDRRAARRLKARYCATQPAPEWAISLLVDTDEESGVVRPIVQLLGPQIPSGISVRLHVNSERDDVRLTTERYFGDPATGTDLVLGTLTVPDGVSVAKIARRDWTVVVGHDGQEIARRCGPLTVAGLLNDEGELQAPDLELVPENPGPPALIPDPVRHLRWTIGLSCCVYGCTVGGYLLTTLTAWLWFVAGPLFALAGILLLVAALLLYTTCPLCGCPTTVVGRTGAQRCDACGGEFSLTPV